MTLTDYQSKLDLILSRAELAETPSAKMQIINQLDDLYLLLFNQINSEYEQNPKNSIIALQDFEETIASAKVKYSRRFFGKL